MPYKYLSKIILPILKTKKNHNTISIKPIKIIEIEMKYSRLIFMKATFDSIALYFRMYCVTGYNNKKYSRAAKFLRSKTLFQI